MQPNPHEPCRAILLQTIKVNPIQIPLLPLERKGLRRRGRHARLVQIHRQMARLRRHGVRLDEDDRELVLARCVLGPDFLLFVVGEVSESGEEAGAEEEGEAAGEASADGLADYGGGG